MAKAKKPKQSLEQTPPTPPRTAEQIQAEYAELCTHAGDKQYRLEIAKKELNEINSRLFQLNMEAAQAQEAKAQEAAKT